MNELRRFVAILSVIVVAGCATSITPVYYTLSPNATATMSGGSDITAEIGPFELPEYLDRPQMVTSGPGATVTLDEFHRWIEPPADIFMRTLAASIGGQLGSDSIFEYTPYRDFRPPYRVIGSVQRFEPHVDGRVVLEVQWAIIDQDDAAVRPWKRTRYEKAVENIGDFDARVAALSEVIERFGKDVAVALTTLSPP